MKNVEDIYPLSPMQQGMLFHTLAGDAGGAYVERISWTLQGELNVAALRKAWQHVIESHPVLRTAFLVEGTDEPLQVVRRRVKLPWQRLDWRGLSAAERDKGFTSLLEGERERGFKLSEAPLLRLTLVEVGPQLHYFLWSYHHLLLDGWSVSLILKDVWDSYAALARRQMPPSGGKRPYRDYIGWLKRQDLGSAEAYWREALKGYRAPVSLGVNGHRHDAPEPSNGQPGAHAGARYSRRQRMLTAELSEALQSLARQQRLTPNTLVQGAWALLLARYSGEQDVVFGTVVSGRPAALAGAETMVGLFINTLPLRAQVPGTARVLDWLKDLQARQVEMRQYEYSPLFEVQRWGEIGGGRPLFESIVVFENLPRVEGLGGEAEAVSIRDLVHHEMATGYPLTLAVIPERELLLQVTYDGERFGDETVGRMLVHLETLLKGIVEDPLRQIGTLPMLTPAEREQVLYTWNDTARAYDAEQCLHRLFEAQVERTPAHVALVFGEAQVSYGELNARANRLAHRLRRMGVGPEVPVGICAERSIEMVVALLAILKAGGAYLPLDPGYPETRLGMMLEDSGATVVLTQESLAAILPPSRARVVCLDAGAEALSEESEKNPDERMAATNPAYVIYTSGSTGRPKGVVNTHQGICNRLLWMQETYQLSATDVVLQKTPYSFDVSVWEFFWPLLTGARLVLARPGGHRDNSYLIETIVKEQVTTAHFVPSMMQAFLETPGVEDCLSLQRVISSGEALTFELQERFHARLGASLYNLYGPTEAAVDVTHWSCERAGARRSVPIGRPIANIQIYLLDPGLQPVPPGVVGELHIGGAGLARGYLNGPRLTAENFIPHPFSRERGARLYRTGDLARFLPDGAIEYLGRADYQVKVRGFRIELGEIEAALAGHSAVREAVVTAHEVGSGDKRLVAYVVCGQDATPSASEFRKLLSGRLPEHMIPSVFIMLDALPLTPSGKVNRRALPAPDSLPAATRTAFVAPRTPTEEILADIWRGVLKTGQPVGIHDDFFESGGHSLLATQLASRIRESFGVEIPLRQLFGQMSLAELARNIEHALRQTQGVQTTPLVPVARERPLPLSFAQQRLWLTEQIEPSGGLYNLPVAVRLTGRLDLAAMSWTLNEVVRRHEVLRTSFNLADAQPVQIIHSPEMVPLPLVDLSDLAEAARARLLDQLLSDETHRPFDLTTGPLLRARLIKLGDADHLALFTMHHIVSDGWSLGVLVREVVALYSAFLDGELSPLPELAVQYADFAAWQRGWLRGEELARQVEYWRGQLAGAPAVLELAEVGVRPGVERHRGAQERLALGEELTRALQELSRREGVTLFMTLLAAWQVLLSRYSGQDDIVVGTSIANRTRAEVEPLIGFFVNMLPLRTQVAGELRFVDFLKRVREVCLGAYAHQDVPFEKLVEELQPERSLSHSPIFQVMFIMQNAPVEALELPGLKWSPVPLEIEAIKFDLTLNITEFDSNIGGVIGYSGELFDKATIERMAAHLRQLLQGIVVDPAQHLNALPMLSDSERLQLLDWNSTAREYATDKRVHEAFEAQAARTPNAVALTFAGQEITYRQLNERANQTARYLRRLGVEPEARAGLMLERSVEMVVALLAILKAGGAYVPLDPAYPPERLAFMMRDAGVALLLTQRSLLGRLPEAETEVVCLDDEGHAIEGEAAGDLGVEVRGESLAYVIYTSGSTGQPKGVMVEHRQLTNTLCASREVFNFTADDVMPCLAAASFDIFLFELLGPLLSGGRCLLTGGYEVLDAASVLRMLEEVTTLHAVPRLLWQFVRLVKETGPGRRFEQVRWVFVGGDAVSPDLLAEVHAAFGSAQVFVGYGPTEATIMCASYAVPRGESVRHRMVGTPMGNCSLRLYDRHGNLAPVGIAGEIYIGGAGVARGYLHREELTREKFVILDGERYYRSGDVGRRLADGNIAFVGRVDEQVKVHGFRIELGEIEAALATHPSVREAVVTAREDDSDDRRLVAYVVLRAEEDFAALELRRHVERLLPAYMIPSAFVLLERLPLTAHGKVDRRALPAPDGARPDSARAYVAPRTPLEQLLVGMWQEALGIAAVGVNDNFFELGGDSIRAVVFINGLQEKLGDYVYVVALFDAPTVAGLAAFLEENYAEAVGRICGRSLPQRGGPTAVSAARIDDTAVAHLREIIPPLAPLGSANTPGTKNPRAVFLLSPPRSGSTLLRVMLAGHPLLFAPPELELLSFNTLEERKAAFAGRDKHWLEGTVHALMELTRRGTDEAQELMRECEARRLTVQQFYLLMQERLGERTLVDKTPSYALDIETLRRAETVFADAAYIHLVRHPCGMIGSFVEAKLDQVFFRHPHPYTTRQLAELVWTVCQQNIKTFLKEVPESRQHRVHFESLVSEPRAVIERMCEFLGIAFHEEMLNPYQEKERRMTGGIHAMSKMLGDVKFHEHRGIEKEVAERWKGRLRAGDELGEVTWKTAEEFGYRRLASDAAAPATEERTHHGKLQPLARVSRDGALAPSYAQQRLWFVDQLQPGRAIYNMPFPVRLRGGLDLRALEQTLSEIVRRHEVLRTTFSDAGGEPVQLIHPPEAVALPLVDLCDLAEHAQEALLNKLLSEETQRPFDLAAGPLVRASLIKLAGDEQVLLLTMHHIVSDGWSMGVLVREVVTLYEAFVRGEPSPLKELGVQYADYGAWQREWLRGEELARQVEYWRGRLDGAPPVLELPTDRVRGGVQRHRGARHVFRLGDELSAGLRELSQREGVTLFMTLLAAWQVLLSRYSGQNDIVVGASIANRTRAEVEPLIGFFVNILALRVDLSADPTFTELLRQVREVCLGAYQHQDMPFEKLVEELQPERSLSHSPIFQVAFVLQNAPASELKVPGLTFSPIEFESVITEFDLTLTLTEKGDGLSGNLEYDTDLFDAESIARMVGHFERLLEGVLANHDRAVSELPLMRESEQQWLLTELNNTVTDYPKHACLHELFEAQCALTPDAIAVIFEDQHLTYKDVQVRANRLARHLRTLGVGPDIRVAVCLDRSPSLVLALLAILKAGGAYVPLDPAYPLERLSAMLADAAPPVILTTEALLNMLPTYWAQVVCMDAEWEEELTPGDEGDESPLCPTTPDNLAYVIYTSGSTGSPKGVCVTHRNVVRLVCSTDYVRLTPSDVVAQISNASFDAATFEVWGALLSGARLVILPADTALSPPDLARQVRAHGVTAMFLTTALFNEVARQLPDCFDGVRNVLFGGEQSERRWAREVVFGRGAPGRLLHVYGPTEATTFSTWHEVLAGSMDDTGAVADAAVADAGVGTVGGGGGVPIGLPIANSTAHVLDAHLRPVPTGVTGELYLGGDGLARGYLNAAKLTAERFVPDPHSARGGARLYRTGDLARRLKNGDIEFVGRVDGQVKIRGFRIELGEVEAALSKAAGVREAVVAAREDEVGGGRRLVAYVVGEEGREQPTATELREHLQRRLPEYMIPSLFVALERVPLTANGKVNRRALPEPEVLTGTGADGIGARTQVEELMAGIWAEVLGVESVGAEDDFFELGGHSLLATQLVSRARETFGVELPLRELFEHPTVAALSVAVEDALRAGAGLSAPPILPVSHEGALPVSFAQQRLWFIDQLQPGRAIYNMPFPVRLRGGLDLRALEQTLSEIVRRHEVLRTTFSDAGGEPVQLIHPPWPMSLPVHDLSELPERQREVAWREIVGGEARRPFDLTTGPLLRARLIKLGDADHLALFTMHHIVSDGWSLGVLVREVVALYSAFLDGELSPLPELAVQYADFAAWQRGWLRGEELARQVEYWREQLAGAPAMLELPTDRVRPLVERHRGAQERLALGEELTRALQELSRREGVTLFMTLLAAWQVLLSRYSGQDDIVVGGDIANRTRAEVEPLIGFFVNMLPLRADLSADPTFTELLRQVREVCLGAYAHQDVPFEKLVEELQPERSLSHAPLFQVVFVLQNAPLGELELPGLQLSPVEFKGDVALYDLTLSMQETGETIEGVLGYSTDLFDHSTIERLIGHFEQLLKAVVSDPAQRIFSVPMLSQFEQRQLLTEWNNAQTRYPQDSCIHDLFEAQAARSPEAIALVFGDERLTYGELNTRANRLARHLRTLGVGPDTRVAVCLDRSSSLVLALVAVLKAGGAYVPLDPAYPPERLAFMMRDAGVALLLTQRSLLGRLPEAETEVVCLDDERHAIEGEAAGDLGVEVRGESLAYVIYTSGSTGQPKGVMVCHANVVRLFAATQHWFNFDANDVWTLFHSYAFDFSVWELWGALLYGGRLVVVPHLLSRSPEAFYELLVAEKVTVLNQTPSAFRQLIEADEARGANEETALRLVIFGGEALEFQSLRPWFERHGDTRPQLVNMYGITETTVHVTYRPLQADDLSNAPGSMIGGPIPDLRVYVLDQRFNLLPGGIPGELYVGGDGLARGYLNRPDLTAERFVPDPFSPQPGARLYRTGDLVRYLGAGELQYLGRVDQQVKIRGFRIELGEIEAALGALPEVSASVVVEREDVPGDKRLVAYVVPQSGAQPSAAAVRGWLRERLPEYMVPSALVFVESLPLTPSGKVNRRALPAPPRVATGVPALAADWRTPAEEVVGGIWAEVLGVESVGAEDDFFESGGHSLLATQLVSRLRKVCGVEVELRVMFEQPTVRRLAAAVEAGWRAARGVTQPPLTIAAREGTLPLSYAQQRLWFIEQLRPGGGLYNVAAALRLTGRLDMNALRATLYEAVRRHEVLRTTFVLESDEPRQMIAEMTTVRLPLIDLSELPTARAETEARRVAADEAVRGFDLATGPVVRATLVRLGSDEHILLFTMHHIAGDGWSMGVLVREVAALYGAYVQREASPLAELEVQYADFAVWQRDWLRGAELARQVEYWRERLDGAPPVLELPTDRVRPALQSFRSAVVPVELPARLTDALKALSRREGATLFMTLLAAWQALLSRYSGQDDIVVGAPIANRTRAEVEPLIGFFVNTLALRADLSADPTFTELLRQVREVCLGAYAHQDVPFEKLVEELQPERSLSHSPIFQVMFALQNAPAGALELPELVLSPVDLTENLSVNFELNLILAEVAGGLKGSLIYHTDLFDATTVERMLEHFLVLLEGIASDPARRLSDLPLLGDAERHRLEVEWNDTGRDDYPRGVCIHELFEAQAAATPEAIALIFGDQQLTYAGLNQRSNQLARYLESLGVGPESGVGLCAERSVEWVVALMAVFKCGGVYVPLDPQHPSDRLSFMVEDACVTLLLTETHLAEKFAGQVAQVVCLDAVQATVATFGVENLERKVRPEDLAYIIYTSGSTGIPKGVMVEHRTLVNTMCAAQELHGFNRGDIVPCLNPFSFDISLFELLSPLLVGGRSLLLDSRDMLDAALARRVLQEVTYLHGVPSLMRQFLSFAKEEHAADGNGQSKQVADGYGQLRQVFVGGDVVSPDLLEKLRQTFPASRIHVGYGPTEATIMCATHTVGRDEQVLHQLVGRPLGNVKLRLYDRHRKLVPVGVDGEIYIGGAGVARGYLHREELTREKFVILDGERYYRSGDVGRRLADGNIAFVGRVDEQVKVHGFRIELGEIEAALAAHEGLEGCAVVSRPGEMGERRLTAYVVARAGHQPMVGELRGHLLERLPSYMIPAEFVVLDELPRTPHGKLDKRALATVGGTRAELGQAYVAPETDIEKLIADAWCAVLGVERVGVHDNFFEAGGTSLLLVNVHQRLQQSVKSDLTMIDLFKYPTVSALAAHVGRGQPAEASFGRVYERVKKQKEIIKRQRRQAQGEGAIQ